MFRLILVLVVALMSSSVMATNQVIPLRYGNAQIVKDGSVTCRTITYYSNGAGVHCTASGKLGDISKLPSVVFDLAYGDLERTVLDGKLCYTLTFYSKAAGISCID